MIHKFNYLVNLNHIQENGKIWIKKTELEKMFGKVKVRLHESEYMVSDKHGILIDVDSHYKYMMMSKAKLGYAFRDWLTYLIMPKVSNLMNTSPFGRWAEIYELCESEVKENERTTNI